MKMNFPVVESILSPDSLEKDILPDFEIGNVITCLFFSYGFNHTYIVKTDDGNTYYARIYRSQWRTLDDIRCELDMLMYLERKQFAALRLCPRKNGGYFYEIEAPEGRRYLVLFFEAPGFGLSYKKEPRFVAKKYGQAVAQLHNALDGFSSTYARFSIDLNHLIDQPLHYIEPFLSHRTNDWAYLKLFASIVRQQILNLPVEQLEQGFCHGDTQGYHVNLSENGTMTFFDFDCGGFGYRAYDLAVFLWFAQIEKQEYLRWTPFLRGYQEIRQISTLDMTAIPLFLSARYIWHMGIRAQNSPAWGSDHLDNAYFDEQIELLHSLERKYL
jgi:Ser/Thr protein kinase RdoA (MazF antagonist)